MPERRQRTDVEADERVRDRDTQEAPDPLGMLEAQVVTDQHTPVVPDHVHAVDLEGVEQCHHVGQQLHAVVSRRRSIGPSRPPLIGDDDAVILGERRDDSAPLPPVLREAVQQKHRIALPCLGDVHPQTTWKLDEAVLDSGKLGEPGGVIHGRNLLVIR